MTSLPGALMRRATLCIATFACLVLPTGPALANSGGGGGAPAETPMNFVLNVGPTGRGGFVLQLQMVAVPANPEAAKLIEAFKPVLQHHVIQIVGSLKPEDLRREDIRDTLAADLLEDFNAELETSTRNGVKSVYFTSFIFQRM
ncbi:flagellar basal body-associated protein FliL [Uliginosibacterium paludis]|uniref:Flagellar protein FliL n=1 Tax=Uliginosibacterium paludis TaxID=1615952 RepID=A0ABV2CQJ2_9RHOO